MPGNDWVSVGEYSNFESAEAVSGRLSVEGVQNQVVSADPAGPLFGALGEWSILVPPEDFDSSATLQEDGDPPARDRS